MGEAGQTIERGYLRHIVVWQSCCIPWRWVCEEGKGHVEMEKTLAPVAVLGTLMIAPIASAHGGVLVFGGGFYGPGWYGPAWDGRGYGWYGPYGYEARPTAGSVKIIRRNEGRRRLRGWRLCGDGRPAQDVPPAGACRINWSCAGRTDTRSTRSRSRLSQETEPPFIPSSYFIPGQKNTAGRSVSLVLRCFWGVVF